MMIKAALPTITPTIEMPEIRFIAFVDFLANKYLFAIYNGVFTG